MNPPFATEEQLVQHYARELADAHIKSNNGEVYRIYMMNHFQSAKVDGVKINDVYLRTYHIAGKMYWQMQVDIPDIGRRSWRGGTHYAQLHERSSGEVTIEDHVLAVRKSFIVLRNLHTCGQTYWKDSYQLFRLSVFPYILHRDGCDFTSD